MPDQIALIALTVEQRDGVFFARSDDVPGLFVVGTSEEQVLRDAPPLIERCFLLNKGWRG